MMKKINTDTIMKRELFKHESYKNCKVIRHLEEKSQVLEKNIHQKHSKLEKKITK